MLKASSILGNTKIFKNMTITTMHSQSPHKNYTSWAYAMTIILLQEQQHTSEQWYRNLTNNKS